MLETSKTLLQLKKDFNFKKIIQDLEELVLADSGKDEFNEIFKIIFAKIWDEKEALENRKNKVVEFRKAIDPEITFDCINNLFIKRVYPGFPTLFWGLSGFFVNDLMGKALWSSWKTRSVFQGAVGAFCASTAPSASTGPICMRQDRRVLGLQSTREWTMFTSKPPTCAGRTLALPRKDRDIRYLRPLGNSDIANKA